MTTIIDPPVLEPRNAVIASRTVGAPFVSVIVPVHQSAGKLKLALEALNASDLPRSQWELIVVDDGSSDDSAIVAGAYADAVVRLPAPARGPAYARNRGAEVARAGILVFVDADVCVHRESLRLLTERLTGDVLLAAVCGVYDDQPAVKGLVSRYGNLIESHEQIRGAGQVGSFWSACGAIRKSVFVAAGMYDEWCFRRPQIEDRELGLRVRAAGQRIYISSDIRVTHLKEWTLRGLLRSAVRDRGIPRTRIGRRHEVLRLDGQTPRLFIPVGAILAWLGVAGAVATEAASSNVWQSVALVCVAISVLYDWPAYAYFARAYGVLFAIACIPLHLLTQLAYGLGLATGWFLYHAVGEPRPDPVLEAFSEVGLKVWPPVPAKRDAAQKSAT